MVRYSKEDLIEALRNTLDTLDKEWENITMGSDAYPLIRIWLAPGDNGDKLVLVVGIEIEDDEDDEGPNN